MFIHANKLQICVSVQHYSKENDVKILMINNVIAFNVTILKTKTKFFKHMKQISLAQIRESKY